MPYKGQIRLTPPHYLSPSEFLLVWKVLWGHVPPLSFYFLDGPLIGALWSRIPYCNFLPPLTWRDPWSAYCLFHVLFCEGLSGTPNTTSSICYCWGFSGVSTITVCFHYCEGFCEALMITSSFCFCGGGVVELLLSLPVVIIVKGSMEPLMSLSMIFIIIDSVR